MGENSQPKLILIGKRLQVAYRGTSFAGYVGLWTGQSPNKFTVSGDQRGKETPCLNGQCLWTQVFIRCELVIEQLSVSTTGQDHWWAWWKNVVSAFLLKRSPVSWLVREASMTKMSEVCRSSLPNRNELIKLTIVTNNYCGL